MSAETKYYEISYIASPALREEELLALDENLRALITSHEATIDSWDMPKMRRLAYQVGHATEAFFGALRFTAPKAEVEKIRGALKKIKELLRFMMLEWRKIEPRRIMRATQTHAVKEEQQPTDEKALDQKLEEIFGETINVGEQTNESQ